MAGHRYNYARNDGMGMGTTAYMTPDVTRLPPGFQPQFDTRAMSMISSTSTTYTRPSPSNASVVHGHAGVAYHPPPPPAANNARPVYPPHHTTAAPVPGHFQRSPYPNPSHYVAAHNDDETKCPGAPRMRTVPLPEVEEERFVGAPTTTPPYHPHTYLHPKHPL
ncbi:hypothetical protein BDY19DRAFT_935965 [Irpex rosettiformis]|uniref:Uncharacterized protein n=1 Tax=Irpex rosettiformis TaxID=378272 RepID=A0ACB8U8E9_9APHY|nr:hypothetical protein BDY19DRAFT_935965 [Irpex rosettiformis]